MNGQQNVKFINNKPEVLLGYFGNVYLLEGLLTESQACLLTVTGLLNRRPSESHYTRKIQGNIVTMRSDVI